MKVIITGGTGLIGRALTASLIDDRHQVVILSRKPEEAKNLPAKVQVAQWDGKTEQGWLEHVEGTDAIVNLAGAPIDRRWTADYREKAKVSRVQAGEAVVAAIKASAHKPKVVLQASAVGYYGAHGDEAVTEETPAGNDFLADVCQAWEASTAAVEELGVRRAIMRTGIVLSKQGGALARMLPIFRFFGGGKLGTGKQYMPWIHIYDQVAAMRFLIKSEKAAGVFNISAPNPVTNKEFTRALSKALNRPAIAPAPKIALKVVFGEMSTILLDGQRAVPQHLQSLKHKFRFNEPETALRHLLYSGFEF